MWYWQKTDQYNRTDSLEIDPQTFSQLILDDGLPKVQWREDSFSRNGAKKSNSKWNVELNTKCKTVNLLEDGIEKNLDGLEHGDKFLDTTSEAQSVKK